VTAPSTLDWLYYRQAANEESASELIIEKGNEAEVKSFGTGLLNAEMRRGNKPRGGAGIGAPSWFGYNGEYMNATSSNSYPIGLPWYRRYLEYVKATKFLVKLSLQKSFSKETIADYQKQTLVKFVFESNNLESEGLSLKDTKELILAEIPDIFEPGSSKGFIEHSFGDKVKVILGKQQLKEEREEIEKLIVSVKGQKRSKDSKTTLNHALACLSSYASSSMQVAFSVCSFLLMKTLESKDSEGSEKILNTMKGGWELYTITEEDIKRLHHTLSDGLLNKSKGGPGQYRNHPVHTDYYTTYPSASDVPAAMKRFVEQLQQRQRSMENPIKTAAWASARLVEIHPFSDFNGRTSRVLMNTIIRGTGFPFWISIRSTAKDRNRYLTALRHFNRGKVSSMEILISMAINDTCEDFNRVVDMSGQDIISIEDVDISKDDIDHIWVIGKNRGASLPSQEFFDYLDGKRDNI
jgi:fido (protein-threonine AMPylation protein)